MKIFSALIVLLFFLSNCEHNNVKHDNAVVSKYIEIRHSGLQEKYIRPLIISTEKAPLDVDRSDISFLDPKKPLTPELKEAYLNANYCFVITDTVTYQLIIDFFNENQYLFTDDPLITTDYSIVVNGKEYGIHSKILFFLRLPEYLQTKKGDKLLVRKIYEYSEYDF